jgi:hypothetical protein
VGYEHQPVASEQALDLLGRMSAIGARIVVVDPRLAREHRLKTFGIEIAIVDLVASISQGLHGTIMQR